MRIDQSVPSEACRRASPREDVLLAGSAFAISRSRSVVISDISAEGAQLDGRDLPPPGDDMVMVVGSQDAMATVVWLTGDKCGIHFDEALANGNIAQMKQEAHWASVAGWWR